MKQTMINYMQQPLNDELYTPIEAIKPLLQFIPNNIKTIWECTDFGESNISKILREKGYIVISTHIKDFNFLIDEPKFDFDCIITNPPYSLKDEFIKRCYYYNKPFALLLPLTALEGINRGNMFRQNGIDLLVLDKRINFMKSKKNNWFNTSWFTYRCKNTGLKFLNIIKEVEEC